MGGLVKCGGWQPESLVKCNYFTVCRPCQKWLVDSLEALSKHWVLDCQKASSNIALWQSRSLVKMLASWQLGGLSKVAHWQSESLVKYSPLIVWNPCQNTCFLTVARPRQMWALYGWQARQNTALRQSGGLVKTLSGLFRWCTAIATHGIGLHSMG